jgi:uncharacterized protein (DUF983 family)
MDVLKDFVRTWAHDWRHNPAIFWLESTGTLVSMLASGLLASFASGPPMWIIFSLWLYGAIAMASSAYLRRNGNVMLLMLWYVGINLIGIINLALSG